MPNCWGFWRGPALGSPLDRLGSAELCGGRNFVLESLALVLFQPLFEEGDGGGEVVVEFEEEVDVVEVLVAVKAVGEVVAWVDVGEHLVAVRAEEGEAAVAQL